MDTTPKWNASCGHCCNVIRKLCKWVSVCLLCSEEPRTMICSTVNLSHGPVHSLRMTLQQCPQLAFHLGVLSGQPYFCRCCRLEVEALLHSTPPPQLLHSNISWQQIQNILINPADRRALGRENGGKKNWSYLLTSCLALVIILTLYKLLQHPFNGLFPGQPG